MTSHRSLASHINCTTTWGWVRKQTDGEVETTHEHPGLTHNTISPSGKWAGGAVQNCTRNESTGYTPYHLIFGCSLRLPISFFNFERKKAHGSYENYVSEWKWRMQTRMVKKGWVWKANKTRKSEPGDQVLKWNLTPRGSTGKIQSYWKDQVFQVTERMGDDCPVFQISSEHGKGQDQVVHRNPQVPCSHLLSADFSCRLH